MTQLVINTPAPSLAHIPLAVVAWLHEHADAPLTHQAYDAEIQYRVSQV